MDIQNTIRDFLLGKLDIVSFRSIYDSDPAIEQFLQFVIDEIKTTGRPLKKYHCSIAGRDYESTGQLEYLLSPETSPGRMDGNHEYDSVHTFLTYEWRMITHDVETAAGAMAFYNGVYSIYYQVDQNIPWSDRFSREYEFTLGTGESLKNAVTSLRLHTEMRSTNSFQSRVSASISVSTRRRTVCTWATSCRSSS